MPDLACDRILHRSPHLTLGAFRCPRAHPQFATEGAITHYVIAFPRTSVWIEHEGTAPFVADPGLATVYNRAQPYRRHAISPHGDRTDWIGFSESLARDLVGALSPEDAERARPFAFRALPVGSRHYVEQCQLFALAAQGADAPALEERAILLAGALLRTGYGTTGASLGTGRSDGRRRLVQDAKAIILSALEETHAVAHLAAQLRVSAFHLCRTFRAATGLTMHEFRTAMRLRTALHDVPHRVGRLSQLAVDVGFYSHAHFTCAFRREFGISPRTFARTLAVPTGDVATLGGRTRGQGRFREDVPSLRP